jgi:tetratricopeptide (TPR) repeat protein
MINFIKCKSCPGGPFSEDQIKNGLCPDCGNPIDYIPYEKFKIKDLENTPPPQINKLVGSIQKELAQNPNDKSMNGALGICFLKLKLQEKALPLFEKAMEDNFSDPNPYYYAAICLLKGKKAFLALRPEIETIEKYLDAAISLDPQGIFYYYKAYIKNDYYERKHLSSKPDSKELLETAKQNGLTSDDVAGFYKILGVERPSGI